ncbi:MAG: hypothetical protein PHG14_15680 [Desulfobacter postgatei]|jgi:hypothetical protein|nr:hypothetical protein [Desulfobacter postgatei]MDD4275156.1 hypothetical protein [Desulfobacter postgatei]
MDFKGVTELKDVPLTLTAINQFRKLLDIMEEFIKATEQERNENHESKPL